MRRMDFYISDFAADSAGFVVSDLDDLISRGVVTVTDDIPPALAATKIADQEAIALRTPSSGSVAGQRAPPGGDLLERFAADALGALARDHAQPIAVAVADIPRRPGLYAIHAPAAVWEELGLGKRPDERPLYVGKAESSLVSRDVDTHFGDGRTGSSTVRRSFAALLRAPLELEGRPRNPSKPERPANYGLSPDHDEKLTGWMRENLTIAVWPTPEGGA
jgi:hypothetical protein